MKIKFILTLLLLFYICYRCSSSAYESPEYVKIAHKITDKVALRLKQEKELHLIGTGGGMMYNVRMMAMCFKLYKELEIKTARELTVYIINEYLSAINNNEKIRPYLSEYPFTANSVEIRLLFQKPDGNNPKTGNLCCISATDGLIEYYNNSSNDLLETMHEETFACQATSKVTPWRHEK